MRHSYRIVSMADGVVHTDAQAHPEPQPVPGEVVPSWNACTIPGCTHDPACPAKLRAWAGYGKRYICDRPGCKHRGCAAQRRAEDEGQPFGKPYFGPVLPAHVVGADGKPLGPAMRAVQGGDGRWRLVLPTPRPDEP
ncbi:MAG: hypothetical protein U0869_10605 [Chloroflexota bacterium]